MTERPRRSGTSIAALIVGAIALALAVLGGSCAALAHRDAEVQRARIDDLVRLLPLIGDRCCCGARTCSAAPVAPASPPASSASAPRARDGLFRDRAQAVPEPGTVALVGAAMVAAWAAKGQRG